MTITASHPERPVVQPLQHGRALSALTLPAVPKIAVRLGTAQHMPALIATEGCGPTRCYSDTSEIALR